MMWLVLRIARFAHADRLSNLNAADHRYPFGYFVLFPVCLAAGAQLAHSSLNKSHVSVAWLLLVAFGIASYFGALLWARLVPAAASLFLGVVVWAVVVWMAWHGLF